MRGTVDSVKDPRLQRVRALSTRDARMAEGACVLEGELLIAQALDAGAELEFAVLAPGQDALAHRLTAAGVEVYESREAVLRQALRTQRPVTALAVAPVPASAGAGYGDFAVVLDGVADPGNLGTIVRTACGLGAPDVVCTDEATDLTSRRVLDASRASVLRAAVHRYPDLPSALEALRGNGFQIVTSSPRGRVVQSLAPLSDRPVALVVGNETDGVSEQAMHGADLVVRIPMAGEVESLNVGVATGLSIAELRLRMILAGIADRTRDGLEAALTAALHSLRAGRQARLAGLDHLTGAEFTALRAIVAGDTAVSPPAETVDVLLHRGYAVESEVDGIAATDAGRHALAALWRAHTDAEQDALARLAPDERSRLLELLRVVGG